MKMVGKILYRDEKEQLSLQATAWMNLHKQDVELNEPDAEDTVWVH